MSAVAENAQSAPYVDFWNQVLAPKFIKYKHILVDGLTHHNEAIFRSLPVKEGDRVLDICCGFGDTAIKLAQRVGSKGKVVGLDCCDAFLEYGREEAARLGLQNISFVNGDALLCHFEPEYDFVFSRFGTMFFTNPVAGLRNMRTALKPGGIMTHVVWRTHDDNPWLSMAKEVVLKFLPPPREDTLTCGPGLFSMADEPMVTKMMEIAGYGDITFKRVDAPVQVGKTVEDAMGFQLAIGPAGEVFREAGAEAEAKRAEIEAAMATAIEAQKKDAGGIVMDSSSWIISGKNPVEAVLRLHKETTARLARLGSVGELAVAVAHELNQPLMAAGTYTRLVDDALRSGSGDIDAVAETARKAAAQVERAAAVVRRLRALVRLDRSNRIACRVDRIVWETIHLCQPDLDRAGVKIQQTIAPGLPLVMVDMLQIQQALLNLMRNSIDAIGSVGQGTIAIEAAIKDADFVVVSVHDSGPGFPPDRAADPFLPLSSTKSEGLGIGLSLCQSLIETHGGGIWLDAETPGATIHFTLPVVGRNDPSFSPSLPSHDRAD